ncbi:uncharacterized protein LOC141849973 [Brevipalpus obovatus]|uniref:uncharacterized protein LOC141849973 n=1 Tax=Brevipalpus obovatus TaxID=246614 RepID=UPI003D9DDF03
MSLESEKDVSAFLMENESPPKFTKVWIPHRHTKYILCIIVNWLIIIGLVLFIVNHHNKLEILEKKDHSTSAEVRTMEKNLEALMRNIVPENGTLNGTDPLEMKLKDLEERIVSLMRSMDESSSKKTDDLSLEVREIGPKINTLEENTKIRLDSISKKEIVDYEDLKSDLTILRENQLIIQRELNSTDHSLPAIHSMKNLTIEQVIPLGFIYTQFPFQKPPQEIWSWATWEDITSTYSGYFFRAEGNDSAPFGEAQLDAIREHRHDFGPRFRLYSYSYNDKRVKVHSRENIFLELEGKTGFIDDETLSEVHISHQETRPKNYAIKIWMRV